MSFSETIFLFFLALIVFGPKKLPEIARQAGRLLAELRRASNEFKSQIETEISQLEVQKRTEALNNQTTLPPGAGPAGTVASLSLNPAASESVPHQPEPAATLAAPAEELVSPVTLPPPNSVSPPEPVSTPMATAEDAASQASHV